MLMEKYLYVLLFLILIFMVVVIALSRTKSESLLAALQQTGVDTVLPNQIGGTVSTQMVLGPINLQDGYSAGNTTVVKKLLGNNGKIIILLHNSPFDQQVWDPLFFHTQNLRESGSNIPTLISYDLRAHGTAWMQADPKFEDANPNNYEWSFDIYTNDLFKIYNKYVKSGKFILAGYGFGGSVAQYYALQYPESIEHLYILQTSIAGVTGLESEIKYFSNWLKINPDVTYLTIDQNYLDKQMCIWFESTDRVKCPHAFSLHDTYDVTDSLEYLIGEKLWREASAGTHLQISKLGAVTNFTDRWKNKIVDFPVTLLGATLDPYAIPDNIKADAELISKSSLNVNYYIVHGKHGFTMIHPAYTLNLLQGVDMSSDPLTVNIK